MCGICGIYNFDQNKIVENTILRTMMDTLKHRGPDDEGSYINGNVGLGHRRLSIIDLSTGKQPISNEDSTVWVVYNGEIYNYKEIRQELAGKGHKFSTNTDTEVLVHLYEEYGSELFKYINGMFAFAIWDDRKKCILLGRDRLGIKPLFYYLSKDALVFGSELKAILNVPYVPRSISEKAVDCFLTFNYIPAPYSIYREIMKLDPGSYLFIKNQKVVKETYWDIPFNKETDLTRDEICDQLSAILTDSVQRQMISDVPLGALLSGGIDSSIVTGIMSKLSNQRIKTFSIGFNNRKLDELPFAQMIANKNTTEHSEFIVEENIPDILPILVEHFDEPFGDSSMVPTYYLSKITREKVKVALSGDGGDELFGGYLRYLSIIRLCKIKQESRFLRHGINTMNSFYPENWRGKEILNFFSASDIENCLFYLTTFKEGEKINVYNEDFSKSLNNNHIFDRHSFFFGKSDGLSFENKLLYLDLKTILPEMLLTKIDRMSMFFSLEVRVPLLDHRFTELAFSLPFEFKSRGSESKYILKEAFNEHLPHEIRYRKKQGFEPPVAHWLSHELNEILRDLLCESNIKKTNVFNPGYIKLALSDFQSNKLRHCQKLWNIMMFQMWSLMNRN